MDSKKPTENGPRYSLGGESNRINNTVFFTSFPSNQPSRPYEIPYQHNDALRLNFNHWMENTHMTGVNIGELILLLLTENDNQFIDKNEENSNQTVIVACLHGVYPIELTSRINELNFLSTCSSLPVRFSKSLETKRLINSAQTWQYMEVEAMNSFLLWPIKPSLTMEQVSNLSGLSLFVDHYLSLTIERVSGYEEVIIERVIDDQNFDVIQLVKEKMVNCMNKKLISLFMDLLLPKKENEVRIVGRLKAAQSNESGAFMYRKIGEDPEIMKPQLLLLWYKLNPDIFEEVPATEGSGISFINNQTLDFLASEDFYEIKAKFISVIPFITENSIKSEEKGKVENEGEKDILIEKSNGLNEKDLNDLKQYYEEVEKLNALEPLLLDETMREMFGFPIDKPDYSEFFNTKIENWGNSNSFDKARKSNLVGLEEGEEEEEEEMDEKDKDKMDLINKQKLEKINQINELMKGEKLKICAIDCEMCSTVVGMELTRISVVCPIRGLIYDSLVKPDNMIINYHTEFSGITEESIKDVTTTFSDVHEILKILINSETIIIGHSLDSDMKALRLLHEKVIDTACLFPHPKGFKWSLKKLVKDFLLTDIQTGTDGHDSVEDSAMALKLAFYKALEYANRGKDNKLSEDDLLRISARVPPRYNLFDHIQQVGNSDSQNNNKTNELFVSIQANNPLTELPPWERSALGYRAESDSNVVFDMFLKNQEENKNDKNEVKKFDIKKLNNQTHDNNADVIKSSINDINKFSKEIKNGKQNKSLLCWLDLVGNLKYLPENENSIDNDEAPKKRQRHEEDDENMEIENLDTLLTLDTQIGELFENAPKGAIILVVTQDQLCYLKQLASRKARYRWDTGAIKRGQFMVGAPKTPWNSGTDESDLITSAAYSIAGALFLKQKK